MVVVRRNAVIRGRGPQDGPRDRSLPWGGDRDRGRGVVWKISIFSSLKRRG